MDRIWASFPRQYRGLGIRDYGSPGFPLNARFDVAWNSDGLNNVSGSFASQEGRTDTLYATTSAFSQRGFRFAVNS